MKLKFLKKSLFKWLATGIEENCRYTLDLTISKEQERDLDWSEWAQINERTIGNRRFFIKQSKEFPELYRFGDEQLEDSDEHKKGYVWSSRASQINQIFDLKDGRSLITAAINNCMYAMTVDDVSALLNSLGYKVVFEYEYGEFTPIIRKKKGE